MEESKPEIKGEDFREGRARGGTALARTKNVHVLLQGWMEVWIRDLKPARCFAEDLEIDSKLP